MIILEAVVRIFPSVGSGVELLPLAYHWIKKSS